ncbi:hypothetical protein HZA73_08255 [candidate division TA06 bacterium]|nr:hypothetical protein [candidate division TA06 bacterium]
MDRVRWIDHRGKRILFEDLSNLSHPQEAMVVSRITTNMITKEQPASVLLISDISNSHFNAKLLSELKENTKATTPYMKAYAVVGVTGLTKVVLKSFIRFTGQDMKVCQSIGEAKDWLASQ